MLSVLSITEQRLKYPYAHVCLKLCCSMTHGQMYHSIYRVHTFLLHNSRVTQHITYILALPFYTDRSHLFTLV